MSASVRWTIKVSQDTDLSLRTFLGAQGMKKGDISKFVEDAVRWRMLDRTVQGIKDRNQDIRSEDLDSIIDQAVSSVRSSRANRPKAPPPGWQTGSLNDPGADRTRHQLSALRIDDPRNTAQSPLRDVA